jgi:hypothetical protein
MGKSLGSEKMLHIARMVDAAKPQVIFVFEIKSTKVKSAELNARFNMSGSFIVPSQKCSGGLWLIWNDDLQVNIRNSSFHLILAMVVHTNTNLKFGLVCIYGDPYHRQTSAI